MLQFGHMKRTSRFAVLAAGLLALAALVSPARAMNDLTTIEQGCLWSVKASSVTSATSFTFDPMGYGSVGYSSVTGNAFLFDYAIYAKGADATYTVVQTTATPNKASASSGNNNPSPWDLPVSVAVLSTSTAITVPASVVWPTHVSAFMKNPVFYFTALTNTATYYIQTTLCTQQKP